MEQLSRQAPVRSETPERTGPRMAELSSLPKLFEPADPVRIPYWVLVKLLYATAPISG